MLKVGQRRKSMLGARCCKYLNLRCGYAGAARSFKNHRPNLAQIILAVVIDPKGDPDLNRDGAGQYGRRERVDAHRHAPAQPLWHHRLVRPSES